MLQSWYIYPKAHLLLLCTHNSCECTLHFAVFYIVWHFPKRGLGNTRVAECSVEQEFPGWNTVGNYLLLDVYSHVN